MPDSSSDHKHQYALAAVPLVAYFCMLTFEQGRYDFLGVPREFVELPPQRIAQLGASTVLLLILLSAVVFFVYHLTSSNNKVVSHLAKSFFYALFFVPLAYIATSNFWSVCVAVLISLFSPWAYASDGNAREARTDGRRAAKDIAEEMVVFLVLAVFFVGIFFGFGKISQRSDTTYNILTGDPSKIVVGSYNDNIIIKSYDLKTGKLQPGVSLISNDQRLDISITRVGPLIP